MPKSERSNPNADGPSFKAPRQRPRWVLAVVCAFLGVLMFVAFGYYDPKQSTHFAPEPTLTNPVGVTGVETAHYTFYL